MGKRLVSELPREPLCTNPGSGLYRLPVLGFECTVPNGVCGLLVELGLYLEGRWTEPEECGGADSEGADPIASFFIASLILLSSLPLLKSTGSSLLLKVDDKKHALLKNVLNQIVSTPGVTGYTAPRFWPESTSGNSHGHSHGHSHTSSNSHEEENNHSHESSHSHTESPVEAKSKSNSSAKPSLVGYIHVQYIDGENSTIIKKRVERIFERANIKVWIQVEAQSSACWCRATSMKDQAIII